MIIMKLVEKPFTKEDVVKALETIDTYVDMLDWQGIIDSDELDELTLNISILESFIRSVKE
jgi:hypothetical protein